MSEMRPGLAADAAGNIYVSNEAAGNQRLRAGRDRAVVHETNTLLEFAAGGDEPVNTLSGSLEQPVGAALAAESL